MWPFSKSKYSKQLIKATSGIISFNEDNYHSCRLCNDLLNLHKLYSVYNFVDYKELLNVYNKKSEIFDLNPILLRIKGVHLFFYTHSLLRIDIKKLIETEVIPKESEILDKVDNIFIPNQNLLKFVSSMYSKAAYYQGDRAIDTGCVSNWILFTWLSQVDKIYNGRLKTYYQAKFINYHINLILNNTDSDNFKTVSNIIQRHLESELNSSNFSTSN